MQIHIITENGEIWFDVDVGSMTYAPKKDDDDVAKNGSDNENGHSLDDDFDI